MTQNQPNHSTGHSTSVAPLINATVEAHCRALRLPTVATQFDRLSQDAIRANQTHASYLATLLGAELEERERHNATPWSAVSKMPVCRDSKPWRSLTLPLRLTFQPR